MTDIKEFRKKIGFSQQQLADATGIPKSRISQWELGNGNPKVDDALKLTNFFITYFPDMEFGETIKSLKQIAKNESLFDDMVPVGSKNYQQERLQRKNASIENTAPLIPVKAQAGYTRAYDQTDFLDTMEKYALPPGITRHGSTWAYWEVEGDSMEPNFYNRDIILTSQVHPMDWNSDGMRNFYTYVVVTGDSVYIKRVYLKDEETWVMISENEDNGYPQFAINPKDVKEVWVFRRHISSRAPASKQFQIKI